MEDNELQVKGNQLLCVLISLATYLCYLPLPIDSNNMIYAIGQIHGMTVHYFVIMYTQIQGEYHPAIFLTHFFLLF